jgi:malonyl-CoA decarboxylase
MDNSFFSDLLASIAERGRAVLKLSPWPRDAENRAASLADMCRALISGRGEASGVALASEILGRYRSLGDEDKAAFFGALAEDFGPDRARVESAVARWTATSGESAASEIHYASEPRRQELFRRLNRAPGATAALVAMRADLIEAMRDDRGLSVLDRDFLHLFNSWFNRGFLVLRRIDWSSPAAILDKIIRYEAVHEIRDWNDLRRRIDSVDRRCYAFFHPALVDEPLIFVEVALTLSPPAAIAPLLAERRAHVAQEKARAATFYSISNCQQGLSGVSFGNFLIKQVVEEIRRELPRIETFVTLSPVPGFRAWVEASDDSAVEALAMIVRDVALDPQWAEKPEAEARMRKALEPLAAEYFLKARRPDGRVVDPVARFHLGNGARLERINPMGDLSEKGLAESFGVMVNYQYDLPEIERNHEAFANQGVVAASSGVRKLLPSAKMRAPAAALAAPDA